jgi:hypothetical protein
MFTLLRRRIFTRQLKQVNSRRGNLNADAARLLHLRAEAPVARASAGVAAHRLYLPRSNPVYWGDVNTPLNVTSDSKLDLLPEGRA